MTESLLYFTLAAYFGPRPVAGFFPGAAGEPLPLWRLGHGRRLCLSYLVLIQRTWTGGYLSVAMFGGALLLFDWLLVAVFFNP